MTLQLTISSFSHYMATGHLSVKKKVASGHAGEGVVMNAEFRSRELDKFVVRLPDGMRQKLAKAARANNRTMNAEIVSRLEQSFSTGSARNALAVVYENTPEADILMDLPNMMQGLQDQIKELRQEVGRKKKKPSHE